MLLNRLYKAGKFIVKCLQKDDRVHVKIPAPPIIKDRARDTGKQDTDKDDLLSLAMRTQAILEKSMPRAQAEKLVQGVLKSKITADAADPARSIRE